MKLRIALLMAAILAVGCGGKAGLKTEKPVQTIPGSTTPALVDIHAPVPDEDYKAAMAQVGVSEVGRHNLDAYYLIAQYKYNHAQYDDALKIYQKVLLLTGSQNQPDKAQYMVGQIYYDRKDFLPALSAFQNVISKSPKSVYDDQARKMMEFILSQSLSPDDLRRFTVNYPDSPLNCFALYQMGSQEARSGMTAGALEDLGRLAQVCPQDPLAADAQMLLKSLQEKQEGKTWKVAILAPITGNYQGLGNSIVNGVKLAVEQANNTGGSKKSLSLVIKDTKGDSLLAVKAFQDLTQDDSLDAVIGPVRANEIEAVAPLAAQKHITLLSPSMTRDGLSTLGPSLFNNSITNEMQGRAIARYAVEKLGFKRFAILAPSDGYGETLADSFKKMVESMGATVTAADTYVVGATDFKKQLLVLGGQDPESTKENEKENSRRFDSLKYSMGKEIGKILLKNLEFAGAAPGTQAVAFAALPESLGNSLCPSLSGAVNDSLKASLVEQAGITLRNDDLVKQAMERLPAEAKGTTLPVTADQWLEPVQDMQANLLIAGRVVGENGVDDEGDHLTWDYTLSFEAFRMNSKKGTLSRIYQSTLTYRAYKDPTLTRGNANYQALYLPAHAAEIPLLGAQVHFYDLNPVFLGGHLWENESVLQYGAKELEGSYFPTGFYVDSHQGNVKKFAEDYQRRFSIRPDLLAAQAYDAARMFLKALDTSSARDDIPRQLLMIKDFDGVSGKTSFDGKAEADKLVPVLRIKNGKYEQVQ